MARSRGVAGSGVEMGPGSVNITPEALVKVRLPRPVVTQPELQLNSAKLPTLKGPIGPIAPFRL